MLQWVWYLVTSEDHMVLSLHLSVKDEYVGGYLINGYRQSRLPSVWSSFWIVKVAVLGVFVSSVIVTLSNGQHEIEAYGLTFSRPQEVQRARSGPERSSLSTPPWIPLPLSSYGPS